MGAVVAAEPDLEFLEGDPLGLFGVSLGLLDLGDGPVDPARFP